MHKQKPNSFANRTLLALLTGTTLGCMLVASPAQAAGTDKPAPIDTDIAVVDPQIPGQAIAVNYQCFDGGQQVGGGGGALDGPTTVTDFVTDADAVPEGRAWTVTLFRAGLPVAGNVLQTLVQNGDVIHIFLV